MRLSRFSLALLFAAVPAGAGVPSQSDWNSWVDSRLQASGEQAPVVQDRAVEKTGRFQIAGPFAGVGSRGDLYDNYFLSAGARYYFSETQGWELLRVDVGFFALSPLAAEIEQKTSFYPDSQPSRLQLSSGFLWSPIYGKYAWGAEHLVHFDVYGITGPGARLTTAGNVEPFVFAGIGSNQFLFSEHLSIVPEFRLRAYPEQRTGSTLVWESIFEIGMAWLP